MATFIAPIATIRAGDSARKIMNWYNQRGETSENSIKELNVCLNTPAELMNRVRIIRWSVYQLAGKVVKSSRWLLLKVGEKRVALFDRLFYRVSATTTTDMNMELIHTKNQPLYVQ